METTGDVRVYGHLPQNIWTIQLSMCTPPYEVYM